jgi:cytoskeleton protein RodZ
MKSIGEALRQERLRRNLELRQISDELKISSRMLAAIEAEQFERLPGGVFSRSFVRQYAQYLGLSAEEVGAFVDRVLDPVPQDLRVVEPVRPPAAPARPPATPARPPATPARQQAAPARPPAAPARPQATSVQLPPVDNWPSAGGRSFSWRSPLLSLGMVVVAMLGCAGVYAWWSHSRRSVAAPEPAAAAGVPLRQAAVLPPPASPPAPTPAPTPVSPAPQPEPNPDAPVRVQLTAAEPVWMSVRSDGKYLFSGVLEANQTRVVGANATVLLLLGNAGGVSITLNGKPIGSVGPRGQIRTVQLTPGGFEIDPPKPAGSPEPM